MLLTAHSTWLLYQIWIKSTHTKCMKKWPYNYSKLAQNQLLFYKISNTYLITVPNTNKNHIILRYHNKHSIFMREKMPQLLKFGTDPNSIVRTSAAKYENKSIQPSWRNVQGQTDGWKGSISIFPDSSIEEREIISHLQFSISSVHIFVSCTGTVWVIVTSWCISILLLQKIWLVGNRSMVMSTLGIDKS